MAMLNYQRVIITLWLFNIAMENGTFIDGLPIKLNIVIFHGYMLHNQMVMGVIMVYKPT